MTTYRCPRCAEHKPREAFGNDYSRNDCRRLYCRDCQRKISADRPKDANGSRRHTDAQSWRDEVDACPDLAPPVLPGHMRVTPDDLVGVRIGA